MLRTCFFFFSFPSLWPHVAVSCGEEIAGIKGVFCLESGFLGAMSTSVRLPLGLVQRRIADKSPENGERDGGAWEEEPGRAGGGADDVVCRSLLKTHC